MAAKEASPGDNLVITDSLEFCLSAVFVDSQSFGEGSTVNFGLKLTDNIDLSDSGIHNFVRNHTDAQVIIESKVLLATFSRELSNSQSISEAVENSVGVALTDNQPVSDSLENACSVFITDNQDITETQEIAASIAKAENLLLLEDLSKAVVLSVSDDQSIVEAYKLAFNKVIIDLISISDGTQFFDITQEVWSYAKYSPACHGGL